MDRQLFAKLAWLIVGNFSLMHTVCDPYFVSHLARAIAAWYVGFVMAIWPREKVQIYLQLHSEWRLVRKNSSRNFVFCICSDGFLAIGLMCAFRVNAGSLRSKASRFLGLGWVDVRSIQNQISEDAGRERRLTPESVGKPCCVSLRYAILKASWPYFLIVLTN